MKFDNLILKQALYNKALDAETAKLNGQDRKAARLKKELDELKSLLVTAAEAADDFDAPEELTRAARNGRNEARRRYDLEPHPYYVVHDETGELEERVGDRSAYAWACDESDTFVTRDAQLARQYAQTIRRCHAYA